MMNIRTTQALFVAAAAALAGGAHAATLVNGETTQIGEGQGNGNTNVAGIDVGSGTYSLGGTGTDDGLNEGGLDGSFNNPIVDYGFYTTANGTAVFTESVGGASDRIALPISSANNTTTIQNDYLRIWTETAPNASFDNEDARGVGRPTDATGVVDISGLVSGSLYVFFGMNGGTATIDATLTGDGQATVDLVDVTQTGTGNEVWLARIDFADAADYDTLTYSYTNSGSVNTHRFAGVVLTAVPEPGSLALMALGGMCVLRRRR